MPRWVSRATTETDNSGQGQTRVSETLQECADLISARIPTTRLRFMGFVIFLLVTATLFLRPSEIVPDLQGFRIYEVLMVGAIIALRREIFDQFRLVRLQTQPVTICAILMAGAIAMSHLQHGFLWGIQWSLDIYYKTLLYFMMLVGSVTSWARFRVFLLTVCLCGTLMVGLCVIDYVGIVDFQFVTHITDRDSETSISNEQQLIWRMRGTGIFEDPNDLCQVITACGVICVYGLTRKKSGTRRYLWLAPIALLALALMYTHSRGGMLSTLAAGMVLAVFKYGKRAAIGGGLLAIPAIIVLGGRQTEIDLEDGTGQDRIQLWSDGLSCLKSSDFFFGIGMGEFADMAGLVAHNSFVHAYTELGVVGGTMFFGMFFFNFLGLYRYRWVKDEIQDQDLQSFYPFQFALLVGWTVGLLSLSRCYVVPTYLALALPTAFLNLASVRLVPQRVFFLWDRLHVAKLTVSSAGCLFGIFVFVKVFARWG